MIAIQRPDAMPKTLREQGRDARASLEREYEANPTGCHSGAVRLPIDRNVYAAADVKEALERIQHGKCAFCEAKITHIDDGDIEHFRPKRGWKQRSGDKLHRPGYYWLAYQWDNLLLACTKCNQRHKGNLFPLEYPEQRVLDHHGDVSAETPTFIDPCTEDPRRHISFNRWNATPVAGSSRGQATIEALGLNRSQLCEHRRDALAPIETLQEVALQLRQTYPVSLSQDLARKLEEIRTLLLARCRPSSEYSAMFASSLDA